MPEVTANLCGPTDRTVRPTVVQFSERGCDAISTLDLFNRGSERLDLKLIHSSRWQLRLEILKGALDSLGRFAFSTAMPCAGYRPRSASDKITNWNGDVYE